MRLFLLLYFDFFIGLTLLDFTLRLNLFFFKFFNLNLRLFIIFTFSILTLSFRLSFLTFLAFFDLLLALSRKIYLAMHFVIIFKHIAYNLTIRDVEITFFQSKCSDEIFLAIFVFTLVFSDLSESLLDMRQPI